MKKQRPAPPVTAESVRLAKAHQTAERELLERNTGLKIAEDGTVIATKETT